MRNYLLLVLGVTACGGREAAPADDNPDQNSATTVDRAAEERTIRSLGEQHAQAVATKDTAHVGDIYAEDVVYLPADGHPNTDTMLYERHGHAA